jgi:hypothetical protein
MKKLKEKEYDKFLKNLPTRISKFSNYKSYCNFQKDWEYYYKNIYCKNHDGTIPPRIFLAESAPSGSYTENTNYIFKFSLLNEVICDKKDMFLYRYYRGVFPDATPAAVMGLTKKKALTQLSKKNILILDILPTHGIKLDTKVRSFIKTSLLETLNYDFLKGLDFNVPVKYAFSVPPSLYQKDMFKDNLKPNFLESGNLNTGQGHAPSIKKIIEIIKEGF